MSGAVSVEDSDQGTLVRKRAEGAAAATRLAGEAAWLEAFAHPGIVRYLGSDDHSRSDPAHAELTTAYAGAVTLADYSPADLGGAASVVAGVAAVVADLHAAGFSHGALTADHVIVGKTRHPVLCSLGDAAELTSDGVQADVLALTGLVESMVERCPAARGRMARRQRRAMEEAVGGGRRGSCSASELAANLVAVPGGAVVAGEPGEPSASIGTKTWRDRVLPEDDRDAGPSPRRAGFALWCTGLAVALWLLHVTGTGELATPPAPWRWGNWFETVDSAAAIVALVRLSAIVCGWYLVVVSVVGALGHRSGTPRFVAVLDRATPAFLRVLLRSASGLTVSAAGLTLAVTPLLAPGEGAVVDTVAADAEPSLLPVGVAARPVGDATEPPAPGTAVAEVTWRSFDFGLPEFEPTAAAVVIPVAPEEWVVETGDHFWRIAQETLAEDLGYEPDDDDVALYWGRLIDANRDRLVDPGNPDLIYPGQVLVLSPQVRTPSQDR